MPLHLAHHKSYHPYNRENIERVQRDEAIAALEEAQAHSSAFSTRDQARLDLLRRQALTQARGASDKESKSRLKAAEREILQGKKGALERFDEKQRSKRGLEQPFPASHSAGVDSTGHINFWADQAPRSEHQRPGQQDTNKQQQQQRKQRESELPFTLSRPAKELQPWYTDAQLQNGQDRKKSEEQKLEDAYKDSTIKSSNDPLKAMEFFLAKRKEALKQKAASTPQPRSIRGFDDDFNEEYSNMFDPDASEPPERAEAIEGMTAGAELQSTSSLDTSTGPGRVTGMKVTSGAADPNQSQMIDPTITTGVTNIDHGHDRQSRTAIVAEADTGIPTAEIANETTRSAIETAKVALDRSGTCLPSAVTVGDTSDIVNPGADQSGHLIPPAGDDHPSPPAANAEREPWRAGSRESMYPELFQQMLCTVLESESYLFSNAELDLLSAFFMMSYAARYLFVRLIQRKKDTWYRLDRLTAYEAEIGDLAPAKNELSRSIIAPSSQDPKIEHARQEEEMRRTKLLDEDKENIKLTLPQLQRNLKLDASTGLSSQTQRRPLSQSNGPLSPSSNSSQAGQLPDSTERNHSLLKRFVLTERDMEGGPEESMSLLTLEELKSLAKRLNIAKIGTTRAQVISALMATKSQATLFGATSPTKKPVKPTTNTSPAKGAGRQLTLNFGAGGKKKAQTDRLREELAEVLRGGCIQVAPEVRSLVDRVALVYYRGGVLGNTALTAALLARSRRRNYPVYGFRRSAFLFPSREHLIAFERAVEIEARIEGLIQFGKAEQDFKDALAIFESIYSEWQDCVAECEQAHPDGIDRLVYHRMRFHPGWVLTRVVYKGATCLARFKMHDREKEILTKLLDQRVFRRGRRGDWYDRLALITALYSDDPRKGKKAALAISIRGIQDPDTHLIYHDTLQRRIMRLESQLRVPRSEQHDFSYSKLKRTTEVKFKGTRLDVMLAADEAERSPEKAMMSDYFQRSPSRTGSPEASRKRRSVEMGKPDSPPTGSEFVVRKPLYKRVKMETFSDEANGNGDPTSSPTRCIKAEDGSQLGGLYLDPDSSVDLELGLGNDVKGGAPIDADPSSWSLVLSGSEAPTGVKKETRTSMRSVWRGLDKRPCHVEELCLQHYAQQGFKGLHCEGKILTMIFALAMWDILFQDSVEGAFETPFQAAPLDLASDAFAIVRGQAIRERLSFIEETGGLELIARTDDAERERRTWAVGCRWDLFSREDVLEVAECLGGRAIAVICQMFCEEWDHCTGGMPDLCIWRMKDKTVRFVEVKGPGDRLSETQKVWIDVLLRAGVDVQVGLVVEA